jgi:hypothetical protein
LMERCLALILRTKQAGGIYDGYKKPYIV